MTNCDPGTSVCFLSDAGVGASGNRLKMTGAAVHYIGDPMCSWCWGLSPVVTAIERFCQTEGIAFSITMGGLRAGGGDLWNEQFRAFLRDEWRHIARKTGQPFSFSLLERSYFEYDTEPACRAVVSVQIIQVKLGLSHKIPVEFFAAIQHKFYMTGQDPKVIDFYYDICSAMNIDFDEFREVFLSQQAMIAVRQAFTQVRDWGVRSFPTLLVERDGRMGLLANGYVSEAEAIARMKDKFGLQPDLL